ncbi:MAG: LuxR C-terminal-related transcriptional regulator [Pseudomonadota bacterium]
MRVQPAALTSTKLDTPTLRARATSDRAIEGPGGLEPKQPDSAPGADADRNAAYALLAEQCRSTIDALPPRQRDVLAGLVAGFGNKEIARKLGISPRTIEIYRAGMMRRLKARTLAQALHIAFVAGLAPSDTISRGTS